MEIEFDKEIASLLKRAAEGSVAEKEFYGSFRGWYQGSENPIKDIVFREIEHYWVHFRFPKSPRNIIENDRTRLRLLAKAIEENWDVEHTEQAISDY